MAVKDVKRYYDIICEQYQEMVDNIKELEREAEKGLIEPERVDRLKEQVAPLKTNYERWSYMIFLLNQPSRKTKKPRYAKQNKKLLNAISQNNTADSVIDENVETLKHIGE